MSNAPTVLMGLVPLFRAVVRSATDATATTVTADDSGTLFVDLSTSAHTYTLPTVALGKGKCWMFMKCADANMSITGGTVDVMMADGTTLVDTVTYSTSSHKIGSSCLVICDGTYFYAINIGATTVLGSG